MSADVTAVVLSIGEPFVGRALASLEHQTEPPAAVVRIDGVTPTSASTPWSAPKRR